MNVASTPAAPGSAALGRSRSLVVAPQWIGDAVMSEPLLARLAERGERLSVCAVPWVAPVFRAMPHVSQVIELPFAHGRLDWAARRRVAAQLHGCFETAYVLPNSIKSALIPWLAGVPRRVGYHGEGRWLLLTDRLPNPAGRPPMAEFYSALAGEALALSPRPMMHVVDSVIQEAVRVAGVERGGYWVLAPGAEYGPAKCWPAEHFAALARTLTARHGQPVLLLGSAKEVALCTDIAGRSEGDCRVLAGKTSLAQAIALIAGARGVVSNDSGLMHVAAALGVPQVAVFGSTSPVHTPPLNPRAQVLWLKDELQLDCAPCFDRVCRFGHTRCLSGVSAQRADAALALALAEPAPECHPGSS